MSTLPTLGIDLHAVLADQGGLLRSSGQSPAKVKPATWQRYELLRPFVDNNRPSISRSDLTEAVHRTWGPVDAPPSTEAITSLCVLVQMWGSGTTNGRGPMFTERAISSGLVPAIVDEARGLLSESVRGDLSRVAAAYRLHRQLPGVGPAFFTKLLWALGSARTDLPIRPLILDSRVWKSLNAIGWNSQHAAGSADWGWRYVAYLQACQAWAETANQSLRDTRSTYDSEDVEYTLFVGVGRQR